MRAQRVIFGVALAAALLVPAAGFAQGQQGAEGAERQHRGPPPEALEACKGKAVDADCSFTGRQGEKLTGTCFAPPAGGPIPGGNGGPQGTPQGSAPAKGAASASKGQSGQNASTRPLACRPAGMGPR